MVVPTPTLATVCTPDTNTNRDDINCQPFLLAEVHRYEVVVLVTGSEQGGEKIGHMQLTFR
jgi:hypothetical protein